MLCSAELHGGRSPEGVTTFCADRYLEKHLDLLRECFVIGSALTRSNALENMEAVGTSLHKAQVHAQIRIQIPRSARQVRQSGYGSPSTKHPRKDKHDFWPVLSRALRDTKYNDRQKGPPVAARW